MWLKDAVTTAGQETSEATTASCLQPAAARTLSQARERRQSGRSGSGSGALKITALVMHSAVCCPRQQPRKRLGALSSNMRYFLSSSFSLATSRTVTQPQRRQEDGGRGAAAAFFFFFFSPPDVARIFRFPSAPGRRKAPGTVVGLNKRQNRGGKMNEGGIRGRWGRGGRRRGTT